MIIILCFKYDCDYIENVLCYLHYFCNAEEDIEGEENLTQIRCTEKTKKLNYNL